MTLDQTLRPTYYNDQFLGATDLTAAIEYTRVGAARHDLGGHTWGIAAGLAIVERPNAGGGIDLFVSPGYATDGFGRRISVLTPAPISADLFSVYIFNAGIDGGATPGRLIGVYLRYVEAAAQQPASGFAPCDPNGAFARVQESYIIEVGVKKKASDLQDPITVAGYQTDAQKVFQVLDTASTDLLYDESVPYQVFPDDDPTTFWLIPLGVVRWLPANAGNPGGFVARNSDDLVKSESMRRYVGVVAGAVQAAAASIRMKDRLKPYSTVVSQDLVWVEGSLRVEGDMRLFGGAVDLTDATGGDNGGIPIRIKRGDANGASSLELVIGNAAAGANFLAVGPMDAGTGAFQEKMRIQDNGNVGIGTQTPALPLHIRGDFGCPDGSSTLHLFGSTIGDVGTGVLSVRSGGNVVAFDGPNNQVGIGTNTPTPNRQLTVQSGQSAYLNVKGNGGAQEVLLGADASGGIVSTMTNHDLVLRAGGNDTKVWIKPNGWVGVGVAAPTIPLEIKGDYGSPAGPATLSLWGSRIGDIGGGVLFLKSGGTTIATDPADSVGIRTNAPSDALDVAGIARFLSNSNPIRFTGGWTAFPDTAQNRAEISNDTGAFQTLMIVGNRSAQPSWAPGLKRRVSIWDLLELGGSLASPGNLVVWGDAWVEGSLFQPSDARLKGNIEPLSGALNTLLQLRGVGFEWTDPERARRDPGRQIGLVAQDVEQVFPDWVRPGPGGHKTVATRGIEALIIEAIRDLKADVDRIAGTTGVPESPEPPKPKPPAARRSPRTTTTTRRRNA